MMKLGVMIQLRGDLEEKFRETKEMGFSYAQLSNWEDSAETDENAALVVSLCEKYGIKLSTYWRGWEGPREWNFLEGPATLGLVPVAFRAIRLQNLKRGSDFAKKIPWNAKGHSFITAANLDIGSNKINALGYKNNNYYFIWFYDSKFTFTTRKESIVENVNINLIPWNPMDNFF